MKKLLLTLLFLPCFAMAQQQVDLNAMSITEIEALLFRLRVQADQLNAQIQQAAQVWQERLQKEQGSENKKKKKDS